MVIHIKMRSLLCNPCLFRVMLTRDEAEMIIKKTEANGNIIEEIKAQILAMRKILLAHIQISSLAHHQTYSDTYSL